MTKKNKRSTQRRVLAPKKHQLRQPRPHQERGPGRQGIGYIRRFRG